MIRFKELITENHLNLNTRELASSEIALDRAFPNEGEDCLDWYKYDNIVDNDLKDEEILNSDEFKNWMISEIESNMDSFEYNINSLIENNKIEIWRAITTNESIKNILKVKKLGEYRSWDETAVEAHWGSSADKREYIFHGFVNINDIDWDTTYIQNAAPDYQEEKEIKIIKNRPIDLIGIYIDTPNNAGSKKKYKDISHLTKNIKFVA